MTHKVVRVDNLMYKGCEPHWICINCKNCYPLHSYTKEEIESIECKANIEIMPLWIKKLLKVISNRARKNAEDMKIIENYYLRNFDLDPDILRAGDGRTLEEFEYGNYPIEEFEDYVRQMVKEK